MTGATVGLGSNHESPAAGSVAELVPSVDRARTTGGTNSTACQLELVGEFARTLQTAIHDGLAAATAGFEWHEEYAVGGTPVDVVGVPRSVAGDGDADSDGDASRSGSGSVLVAVELEVRRADPANNTVKLLRHLDAGALDRYDRVVVCQPFSNYYDLASGGVSTKRENAAFVGRLAERADDRVAFHAVDLPVDPPKRGEDPPADWAAGVDDAVAAIEHAIEDATSALDRSFDGEGDAT